MSGIILEVKKISKDFSIEAGIFKNRTHTVKALDNVSFGVEEFSTLGVVGESGSGKTTLAKIILRLIQPTSGELVFDKQRITNFRKDVQIVFQNPYNSLNPSMRILDILTEPFLIHKIASGRALKDRVVGLLGMVGLDEKALNRYPKEFSGGQRQRICIGRALATAPRFIVLDEPISSLDLIIQDEMLDLFLDLKKRFNLTYIFISHNLAVIKYIADRVLVMKDGRIVEEANVKEIFNQPRHYYTKMLLECANG